MNGFLLTWNPVIGDTPGNWSDDDLVRELIRPFKSKGFVVTNWRTASPRMMERGDVVFLLQQGRKPAAIFGAGVTLEKPRRKPNEARRFAVKVKITKLSNPVKGEFLISGPACRDLLGRLVATRFSGRRIPDETLERLLKMAGGIY